VELLNLTFEREPGRNRDSNVKFAPLSCPPFQDAGVDIRGLRASVSVQLPMGMAGGVIIETTVDQTLMRGSEPHDL
jgi:hypothetical protein